METKFWQMSVDKPDLKMIKEAATLLREGQVVAFPTETVYGLGANALDSKAIKKIYLAKGRPDDNPLIVHISDVEQLNDLVTSISPQAQKLIDNFWPGPLTLVMAKSTLVPPLVTGGLDTVAVRMPAHPIALKLIHEAQLPIAAPSANISGKPSPTTAQHVWQDLQGKIAGLIDGGHAGVGVESTVLDLTTDVPTILRPGGITLEELKAVLGDVKLDPHLSNKELAPKAPGMKYTHYAPEAPVFIVEGNLEQIKAKFMEIIKKETNTKVGLMVSQEVYQELKDKLPKNFHLEIVGERSQLALVAANLFSVLRQFDQGDVDIIYAESFPQVDIGAAIMNRLYKAAGGNKI